MGKINNRKFSAVLAIIIMAFLVFSGCGNTVQSQEASGDKVATTVNQDGSQFKNRQRLEEHYQKHVLDQQEFGDATIEEYLAGAQGLVDYPGDDVQIKTESDGDMVCYREKTNEFGVKSKDGVIRTYFKPERGAEYFNEQ
ncbi:MAG: hypothetical protein RSD88_02805 [Anaerovoracaceae bacterium]